MRHVARLPRSLALLPSAARRGREAAFVPRVPEPLLEPLLPPGPARPAWAQLAAASAGWTAPATRPFTYLNMIATADGRAAVDGRTEALGDAADLEMLLELRVLADAVLIGPGTLRAEGYDRLVRAPARRERRRAAGRAEDPLAVVISRRFDLPWDAGLFAAAEQPVLLYTAQGAPDPPSLAAPVEVVRLDDPTPAAAFADLRARGVELLLCEGGPTLNRGLLEARLVDELFLTLAPLLTCDDLEPTIVAGPALPEPARLGIRSVLRHRDELFLRYAVAP
jgi:riboflavin biosynthesis pyrimidine reductase